jgi:hypothetical protein
MKFSHAHVLFLAMIMVALLDRFKQRWYLFALLALPSTFMHELTHFLTALITLGKPVGMNLLPQRSASGYQLGQVTIANPTWFNRGIIGLAPLLLIPGALVVLREGVPVRASLSPGVLFAYLLASMIYGCFPSVTDWRMARKSPLGLLAALSLICFAVYGVVAGSSLNRFINTLI